MIGTHNSLTYAKPKCWLANLVKGFWRCQEKDLEQQLEDGVKFFDIRLTFDKDNHWVSVAHGKVDLKISEAELTTYFAKLVTKNAYFRILIERGTITKVSDVPLLDVLLWLFPDNIVEIRVKNTWLLLYKHPTLKLELKDLTFVPFHADTPWWKQASRWKNVLGYPIKKWVKKHKLTLTKEQVADPNVVYFVDYYNLNNIEYDKNNDNTN